MAKKKNRRKSKEEVLQKKIERLNEGVLCIVQNGFWDAIAKYDKKHLGEEVPKAIVKATQDLIDDKTLISDIKNIQWRAKYLIQANSMPFPIDGVFFLPKNVIAPINEELEELHEEFEVRVAKLVKEYDNLVKKFKRKYPNQYNMQQKKRKYPTKKVLRDKFYLRWSFFNIEMPDSTIGILDPNEHKRAMSRFENMIGEMEDMALNIIGNDLFERLGRIQNRIVNNEPVHGKNISSINTFLDKWSELWQPNVDDRKMKILVSRLKKEMKKVELTKLKDNQNFREEFSDKIATMMGKIESMPAVRLKRSLKI